MTYGNESAFPEVQELPQFSHHTYGLTKREYFASMAMQGLLADSSTQPLSLNQIAISSVEMAEALIKELNEVKVTFKTEKK